MKIGAILAAVLLGVAAVLAVIWISIPDSSRSAIASVEGASPEPVPSETGPHPKVVLPETVHEFGMMRMGDSGKHVFVVRNEGEAPLKLGKPRTTCQCTVSESAQEAIPPGGEGTITLEWTPTSPTESFEKGAVIRTNDPKLPEIRLNVSGQVETLLETLPVSPWNIGLISGDKENEFVGYISSKLLDGFEITSVESKSPLLAAEAISISPEELSEHGMKSGYKIRVKVSPGMPVGKFSEELTVKTDLDDEDFDELAISVMGTRHGPIQILPTPGVGWNAEALAIDLGRFPAAEGKSGSISMFVSELAADESLVFESVETSEPYVEVELQRDEDFQSESRQRYELTFRVPPGSPAVTHRSKGSVHVDVSTNHPQAREMKFFVQFISTP